MASPRAVSVDVDGTLYAKPSRWQTYWRMVRHPEVRHAVSFRRGHRPVFRSFLRARQRLRGIEHLADATHFAHYVADLMAADLRCTFAEASALRDQLLVMIPELTTRGVRPFPGVRAALSDLCEKGVILGIISDYDPTRKLHNLGLVDLPWRAMVACDQVGALKPSARPFLSLAERLGVAPHDVVHIGDREDTDVTGARAAGMRAWRFAPPSTAQRTESHAEFVFSRWSQVTLDRLSGSSADPR